MFAKIKAVLRFFLPLFGSLPWTTWLTLLVLFFFLSSWIFSDHGLYKLEGLIRMKRGLLHQQKELLKEKESLEAELKWLEDPDYLKHLIHKEMGFVEKGELIIKFTEKKPEKK